MDELKKRLGKLEKSSSCTNLMNKTEKKTQGKVVCLTKLTTEESKCSLKKKGRQAIGKNNIRVK